MSDLIKIYGGNGDVPVLQDRVLAYRKDTKELFVGMNGENVKLCRADDITKILNLEERLNNFERGDVFYANYGVTTGEEINEAYTAGKAVICKLEDGRLLYLTTDWGTGNGFTFSSAEYARVVSAEVDGSYWTDPIITELATKEEIEEMNARLEVLENQ